MSVPPTRIKGNTKSAVHRAQWMRQFMHPYQLSTKCVASNAASNEHAVFGIDAISIAMGERNQCAQKRIQFSPGVWGV